jgi:hypothetical protein
LSTIPGGVSWDDEHAADKSVVAKNNAPRRWQNLVGIGFWKSADVREECRGFPIPLEASGCEEGVEERIDHQTRK